MSDTVTPPRARVLLACETLVVAGGVERFVCHLANALALRGHGVTVSSADPAGAALAYPLAATVHVALAGDAPLAEEGGGWRAWRLLRRQWHVGRSIGRVARDGGFDVVVLNGLVTACAVLALHPSLARRSICCDHNHFAARSRFWRWLRRLLYPRVAAVVSLTRADAARFTALNARTRVIANASSLMAERPADVAAPIALAIGRHQAQKGFDLLLAAWAGVVAALPQARLRIVGAGPLSGELHRLASELGVAASVDWTLPTPAIEAIYRSAAVFVLSSRYEGMPLALLEAQALGLPIVTFACPTGPAEIVDADSGIVVAPEDTAALERGLVELLGDLPRRQRMGRAAIARSRAQFSMQRHLDAWADLIDEVALQRCHDIGPGRQSMAVVGGA
ncbi:MAG: glycosyltransferase, partial [Pseudomonadota bacterium]|nr:glycosyltransferase [Pseudomonadota bacterium]